jgi:chromate transporter
MKSKPSFLENFLVFLKLGCTSFGGPVAHIGYFHNEFVVRRKWLDERAFADIVALCQFLPGPASSQVNLAVGMHRAQWKGALGAWIGFTMPSAILMTGFAYGVGFLGDLAQAGWLKGLKLAAVAVVAQAVWVMVTKFCGSRATATLALAGAMLILAWPAGLAQVGVIAGGAVLGWILFRHESGKSWVDQTDQLDIPYGRRLGAAFLVIFLVLLLGLPILTAWTHHPAIVSFDRFYRAGSLVFGGGHVVLPLLQTAVVDPGWVSNDQFLAGYGAAQAVPGPLFSFSAYLGAVMKPHPNGWMGALWCLMAIYLPSALLVFGSLPFWEAMRRQPSARAILKGANAAVVGVLMAALYHPVWTSAVHGPVELILAMAAYGVLVFWNCPPWLVVLFSAGCGEVLLR